MLLEQILKCWHDIRLHLHGLSRRRSRRRRRSRGDRRRRWTLRVGTLEYQTTIQMQMKRKKNRESLPRLPLDLIHAVTRRTLNRLAELQLCCGLLSCSKLHYIVPSLLLQDSAAGRQATCGNVHLPLELTARRRLEAPYGLLRPRDAAGSHPGVQPCLLELESGRAIVTG